MVGELPFVAFMPLLQVADITFELLERSLQPLGGLPDGALLKR